MMRTSYRGTLISHAPSVSDYLTQYLGQEDAWRLFTAQLPAHITPLWHVSSTASRATLPGIQRAGTSRMALLAQQLHHPPQRGRHALHVLITAAGGGEIYHSSRTRRGMMRK
mmetsp:Transcript_21570/g.43706  ORF Transcript_21570/g.43706 Transcript_21570/m.43706 type:complete len:112 (-) Transcript_21570:829-1164(-)